MRVFVTELPEKADLAAWLPRLSEERRAWVQRARSESVKKQSTAAELLLRHALSAVCRMDDLPRILRKDGGKPYFPDHPEICFNLSHCKCGVTCALAAAEVGVDIQDYCPVSPAVIRRVLCDAEQAFLTNANDTEKAFAYLWSRKEAFLKMQGCGIASDLSALNALELADITTQMFDRYAVSFCSADGSSCEAEIVHLFEDRP